MKKSKSKGICIPSLLCCILAVLFFLYGIYMIIYAVDYVRSYERSGLVDIQNIIQYVVTSSSSYLGFAVLLFAAGHIIRLLKNLQPASAETTSDTISEKTTTSEETASSEETTGERISSSMIRDIFEHK